MKSTHSLRHCLLIATPMLKDEYFAKTVTYICEHNERGAFGVIISRPSNIKFGKVLDDIGIECKDNIIRSRFILEGGPVQRQQGMVVYRPDQAQQQAIKKENKDFYPGKGVAVSCSKTMLNQLGTGEGPKDYQVCFGYAGWTAGQLEKELRDNGWLIAPFNDNIIFDIPYEQRWKSAAASIGVDFAYFSNQIGHA